MIAILTNGMILTAVNPYPAARTLDAQHAIAGESVCNGYRLRVEATTIVEGFSDLKITIRFSEGTPNIRACDDIKVTDMAPVVRTADGQHGAGISFSGVEPARAERQTVPGPHEDIVQL